jgi:hypothetical protein
VDGPSLAGCAGCTGAAAGIAAAHAGGGEGRGVEAVAREHEREGREPDGPSRPGGCLRQRPRPAAEQARKKAPRTTEANGERTAAAPGARAAAGPEPVVRPQPGKPRHRAGRRLAMLAWPSSSSGHCPPSRKALPRQRPPGRLSARRLPPGSPSRSVRSTRKGGSVTYPSAQARTFQPHGIGMELPSLAGPAGRGTAAGVPCHLPWCPIELTVYAVVLRRGERAYVHRAVL